MAIANYTQSKSMYWPCDQAAGANSYRTGTMDATGEKVCWWFRSPVAGEIESVTFRTATVVQCTNGLRVSLQNIDETTDAAPWPDGTQDQYRDVTGITTHTLYTTGRLTDDGTDDGTRRTVAIGDWLAIVIDFVSFDTGDDVDLILTFDPWNSTHARGNAGQATYAGGAWTGTTITDSFAVAMTMSDGTRVAIGEGSVIVPTGTDLPAELTMYNGAGKEEHGMKWTAPYPLTTDGCLAFAQQVSGANATGEFRLYVNDDTTPVRTAAYDSNIVTTMNNYGQKYWKWDEGTYDIKAGDVCRLTFFVGHDVTTPMLKVIRVEVDYSTPEWNPWGAGVCCYRPDVSADAFTDGQMYDGRTDQLTMALTVTGYSDTLNAGSGGQNVMISRRGRF